MADLLALLAGKPKDKPEGPAAAPSAGGGAEDAYAREAFSALQEGDEQGFVDAFKAAVRSCVKKGKAGAYEAEPDADDM